MKTYLIFCSLLTIAWGLHPNPNECLKSTQFFCEGRDTPLKCNAIYGDVADPSGTVKKLSEFAVMNIKLSFDYLLLAVKFGNFETERKGIEKLFRHFSDSTWNDGIEVIKHISKRGGTMDFSQMVYETEGKICEGCSDDNMEANSEDLELKNFDFKKIDETTAFASALDKHKSLAKNALDCHHEARKKEHYDPEILSFLENNFLHKHADGIRSLTGHLNDVINFVKHKKHSVPLFIFDEYLHNHY